MSKLPINIKGGKGFDNVIFPLYLVNSVSSIYIQASSYYYTDIILHVSLNNFCEKDEVQYHYIVNMSQW